MGGSVRFWHPTPPVVVVLPRRRPVEVGAPAAAKVRNQPACSPIAASTILGKFAALLHVFFSAIFCCVSSHLLMPFFPDKLSF
jgi:hypothetical protein